jgi:predicted phosphodiesterase
MTKILILPDIHGRPFWKDAVEKHFDECDKIVFLGDYLDAYPNEEITRKQEKNNFSEIISFKEKNADKVVLLLGNHDLHYIDKDFTRSTRYSSGHAYSSRQMYLSHMSLFNIAHEETINGRRYLFTHAGVMNSWYERNKDLIGELNADSLNKLNGFKGGMRVLGDVSKYRSWLGYESGSPVWSDVKEKIDLKKSKIDNILPNEDSIVKPFDFQIFGHTQLAKNPIETNEWICIDCRRAFILDDEGKIIDLKEESKDEKIETDKEHGTVQDTENDKP